MSYFECIRTCSIHFVSKSTPSLAKSPTSGSLMQNFDVFGLAWLQEVCKLYQFLYLGLNDFSQCKAQKTANENQHCIHYELNLSTSWITWNPQTNIGKRSDLYYVIKKSETLRKKVSCPPPPAIMCHLHFAIFQK